MTLTPQPEGLPPKPGAPPYGTLLVHAEPRLRSSQRVEVAARLARQLNARLIGVGAEDLDVPPTRPGEPRLVGRDILELAALVEEDLAEAETAFRRDAANAQIEWRRFCEEPTQALLRMAHAADLILVSPLPSRPSGRDVDPRRLVVEAGRPVLVVPSHARRLRADTIVVAWKDTREARRAAAAAMPFLGLAREVVVHAVGGADDLVELTRQTEAVAASLRRRGVTARSNVTVSKDGVVNELMRAVSALRADMLVAGAYGHSRLQELVLGGVTEQLLRKPACFVLMAH
jgi:nucleotide-binding universal stress UspA family protein